MFLSLQWTQLRCKGGDSLLWIKPRDCYESDPQIWPTKPIHTPWDLVLHGTQTPTISHLTLSLGLAWHTNTNTVSPQSLLWLNLPVLFYCSLTLPHSCPHSLTLTTPLYLTHWHSPIVLSLLWTQLRCMGGDSLLWTKLRDYYESDPQIQPTKPIHTPWDRFLHGTNNYTVSPHSLLELSKPVLFYCSHTLSLSLPHSHRPRLMWVVSDRF